MTKPAIRVKAKRNPKLTDSERHARFVETARKVSASEDPKDFDMAFKKVTRKSSPPNGSSKIS
jgi:hypothetical protein